MAFNASSAFNSPLSLFSSLYQDMNPADLPEGLSPDNQDVSFLPGSVGTRPGLSRELAAVLPNGVTIQSIADFPLLTGDYYTMMLDSLGNLWKNDVDTGAQAIAGTVSPGVQFKSESAFGKQWFAFFGQALSADFAESPFVGVDIPRYSDGDNVYRVTSDAPGAPPTVADSGTAGTTTAGVHKCVVFFKSFNGANTAPSIMFTFTSAGTLKWNVTNIPIGPAGTQQRVLAFTAAGGSSFFYITPTSASGVTTIINDNTVSTITIDFTDTQLLAGTAIDVQGNNLFNQISLAPCLGVIEYQSRLFWWGEINNIKNFVNMSFDGGYVGSLAGPPLGWVDTGTTGGTTALVTAQQTGLGWALEMSPAGGAQDCLISQSCFQDFYGAPILTRNTDYLFRVLISQINPQVNGFTQSLQADISSVSAGGTIAGWLIFTAPIPSTPTWVTVPFTASLPANEIPSDALLKIFLTNVPAATKITIDEIQIIDAHQPVLAQQMRASYINNPFAYDEITGILGFDTTENVVAAFKQRGYLYPLTDRSLFQTSNNGSTEPNGWNVTQFAEACGCCSPCAVDSSEGAAFWVGRTGHRVFVGDTPKKISQEVQAMWDSINWDAQLQIWLVNDPISRAVYIGLPTGEFSAPNIVYPMSYRSVNAAYEVPDPLHISYSGRMIASDLCRKSTKWNVMANCGAMLTRQTAQGITEEMVFGGGNGQAPSVAVGFGQLYTLDPAKLTDDDYGVISSYYVTYAHWSNDIEQNVPAVGAHRKIYTFLSAYITGVGNVTVTPLVDRLGNAVPALQQYELSVNLDHDLEWGMNVIGDRVFFKVAVLPLPGTTDAAFNLQQITVAGREDAIFKVRGAVL